MNLQLWALSRSIRLHLGQQDYKLGHLDYMYMSMLIVNQITILCVKYSTCYNIRTTWKILAINILHVVMLIIQNGIYIIQIYDISKLIWKCRWVSGLIAMENLTYFWILEIIPSFGQYSICSCHISSTCIYVRIYTMLSGEEDRRSPG